MTFIWGGTFLFTKIGLQLTSPALYVILRYTIALLICLIFFGKNLRGLSRHVIISGFVLGLFFSGGFLLQTIGLKYTTVSKSAFITGVSVVLTPIAYWMVERRKIGFWQIAGVFIVSIGLWLFTNPEFNNINLGDALTLLSTILWALYITYMNVFTKGRTSFIETSQLVMMQFIAALPVVIIYFLLFESSHAFLIVNNALLISLAYNGILASFFLTLLHTSVQRYTTPVKAALIFSLEPIIASLLAFIFMREILDSIELLGAAILIIGIIISETGDYFFGKLLR
jgi:drug/metabolite transporter (DMT)-like permease